MMLCHLLVLCLLSLSDYVGALTPGENPLFFNNYMQRCNCWNNEKCNEDGRCPDGLCAEHFIGIHCQHVDITTVGPVANHNIPPALLDGNLSSCLFDTFDKNITLETFPVPFHFVWIYLTAREGKQLSPNLVAFNGNASIDPRLFYNMKTGSNAMLIKSRQPVRYTKLELINQRSICTVHVSVGRNLAISGKTRQSSDNSPSTTSHEANDGYEGKAITHTISRSCAQTTGRDGKRGWWEIVFPYDALINEIVIISKTIKQCPFIDLRVFSVNEAIGKTRAVKRVFEIKLDEVKPKQYIHILHDEIINHIFIETFSNQDIPIKQLNCSGESLALCEVQVFGEYKCPNGKSGALCDIPCPGCTSDRCDPDWGCLKGCSQGWSGPWCSQSTSQSHEVGRCNAFTYGPNCEYECEDNCANEGLCNEDTGHCRDGCKPGFFPPNCQQRCPEGRYGMNCAQACIHCSKNITSGNFSCEHTEGLCLSGCDAGYEGDTCEILTVSDGGSLKSFLKKYLIFCLFGLFCLVLLIRSMLREDDEEEILPEDHLVRPNTSESRTENELLSEDSEYDIYLTSSESTSASAIGDFSLYPKRVTSPRFY